MELLFLARPVSPPALALAESLIGVSAHLRHIARGHVGAASRGTAPDASYTGLVAYAAASAAWT